MTRTEDRVELSQYKMRDIKNNLLDTIKELCKSKTTDDAKANIAKVDKLLITGLHDAYLLGMRDGMAHLTDAYEESML